jgi:transglutaminase-like putative cysteine protease
MNFSIVHITKFRYSEPVTESVMEIRMQPRTDETQRCLQFALALHPNAEIFDYVDCYGNEVHHFDIPKRHSELEIFAKAYVEVLPQKPLPESLSSDAWSVLDFSIEQNDLWDYLLPSHFAKPTDLLLSLAEELNVRRHDDPLTVLKQINEAVSQTFEYTPNSTHVDSPIDDAITQRRGVCQDFSNIMVALVRELKIPCRYVSGYLFHNNDDRIRLLQDATHAWVEAYLPQLGWIGFDPTNNTLATERHIAVAVGRDYADVPPTRGVFKGNVDSELNVAVKVLASDDSEIDSVTREIIKSKEPTSVSKQSQQAQQQ